MQASDYVAEFLAGLWFLISHVSCVVRFCALSLTKHSRSIAISHPMTAVSSSIWAYAYRAAGRC
jgi:hypothetical protein